MKHIGNIKLLQHPRKIGFLCSRKVPAEKILEAYDWAKKIRNKDVAILIGDHSQIERDVLDILSKGTCKLVVFLARNMYTILPKRYDDLIVKRGILLISLPQKHSRISQRSATIRNQTILEKSLDIYIPFISTNGNLAKLFLED